MLLRTTENTWFSPKMAPTPARQLEVLERGAYRWEKPIFFLEETAGYFDGKDTVVLFNGQEATTYSRFSDVPTYINVSGEN